MQSKKNKLTIISLAVVFIMPVVLAKFALELDWFNKASTNRGELIASPLDASSLLQTLDKNPQGEVNTWKLLMTIPAACDKSCQNSILTIKQVREATGKHMHRVDAVFIATADSDAKALGNIEQNQLGFVINQTEEGINTVFSSQGTDAIFISDTLNNIVLKYPSTEDSEQAIMDGRDVLSDLRKLLKLSRIG